MTIRDPIRWAAILDANPFPPGCSPNPAEWLAWSGTATFDERDALYGAMMVLVAEQWAERLETLLEAAAAVPWIRFDLGRAAIAILAEIVRELGPFTPSAFQLGAALAILVETWTHGPALQAALQCHYLEHLTIEGVPS